MKSAKAGIELIVFQGREKEDLDGVVKECSQAGYACIEGGLINEFQSPAHIKDVCQKYNIQYAAGHGGYDTFKDEKKLAETAEKVKEAGGKYIICSGVANGGKTIADYRESARIFNRAGRIAAEFNLIFCYHNHAFEFVLLDKNTKGIHVLSEETDPSLVKFNIDVAWVQIGGESPAEFIRRYRERAGYYHFKDAIIKGFTDLTTEADLSKPFDMANVTWTELGKGNIKLASAYNAAVEAGADYIIYEEDIAQIDVRQAIVDSRRFLRELGI